LIHQRGNIYVAYAIAKFNVYTEGKRTRDRISSNIRITNVQSCSALIFYDWNKTGYMRRSLGSHPRQLVMLVPNKDPDFQVVVCFTSREWRWRWLFALLKLVELLTITFYYSIFIFLCRVLNIVAFPFFIFSFDHLTILKQSLVIHLMACNSFKYWLKSPISKTETISQLYPSV